MASRSLLFAAVLLAGLVAAVTPASGEEDAEERRERWLRWLLPLDLGVAFERASHSKDVTDYVGISSAELQAEIEVGYHLGTLLTLQFRNTPIAHGRRVLHYQVVGVAVSPLCLPLNREGITCLRPYLAASLGRGKAMRRRRTVDEDSEAVYWVTTDEEAHPAFHVTAGVRLALEPDRYDYPAGEWASLALEFGHYRMLPSAPPTHSAFGPRTGNESLNTTVIALKVRFPLMILGFASPT